jgi:hypothetical protein
MDAGGPTFDEKRGDPVQINTSADSYRHAAEFYVLRSIVRHRPDSTGNESDDALGGLVILVANALPDRRVRPIADHCDLDVRVTSGPHRRRDFDVLLPAPVLISVGVQDQHRRRVGLEMVSG